MTVREMPTSKRARDLGRVPRLVRIPGQRCDFCGSLTATAAVAASPQAPEATICPVCVARAARQLLRSGGGDAA